MNIIYIEKDGMHYVKLLQTEFNRAIQASYDEGKTKGYEKGFADGFKCALQLRGGANNND